MQVTDKDIRHAIESLLESRQLSATICPSEAARALNPKEWRPLMPQVRAVAVTMARDRALVISQAGHAVDPDGPLRGPIRLGRPGP